MKISTFGMAVIAALAATAPAHAAFYTLNYAATAGSPLPTSALFRIQTSDVANADGGFTILKATGSYTAGAITTKVTSLAPLNPSGFNTDNIFYKANPAFTSGGLGVLVKGGDANLWGNSPGAYSFWENKGGYSVQTTGTLTVAAGTGVPEPGVWAMLITGFGLVGFAARRRVITVAA